MFGSLKRKVAVSATALSLGLAVVGSATPAAAYWPGGYGHGWSYGRGAGYAHWNGHQNYVYGGGCGPYNDCRPWRHGPWSGDAAYGHGPAGYEPGSSAVGYNQGSSVPVGHGSDQGSSGPVAHNNNQAGGFVAHGVPAFIDAHPSTPTGDAMAVTAPKAVYNVQRLVSGPQGPVGGSGLPPPVAAPRGPAPVGEASIPDVVDVVDNSTPVETNGPANAAGPDAPAPVVDANANMPAAVADPDANANAQAPPANANASTIIAGTDVQPTVAPAPAAVAAVNPPTIIANATAGAGSPGATCTVALKPVFDDTGATIGFHALNSCK